MIWPIESERNRDNVCIVKWVQERTRQRRQSQSRPQRDTELSGSNRVSHTRVWLFAVALLIAGVTPSGAEWPYDTPRRGGMPLEVGVRAGYDYDGDVPSAGAQMRVPIPRLRGFMLVPSADIFDADANADDRADWQMNVDLLMSAGPRGGLYAGLGFGWVEEGRPKRERAINQVLGLRLPVGRRGMRAYIEGRWTELARDTVFRLVGGVNIPLFRY